MAKVGETLHGFRVVETYDGNIMTKGPLFSGFEGIIVWNTWDTGEWQVLEGKKKDGEYTTREIGLIDDEEIQGNWTGEQIAEFIKNAINTLVPENNLLPVAIDTVIADFMQNREKVTVVTE